ncbi:hypothetical protein [Pyrococcus yayanosii]|uniref:hypothetical protein n=1 Tax=Pyrococcus yayanosii TaxID=1008460 RepID=UPI00064FAAFB|nr:hypothetical protein [Pyrococcus yayanosii]
MGRKILELLWGLLVLGAVIGIVVAGAPSDKNNMEGMVELRMGSTMLTLPLRGFTEVKEVRVGNQTFTVEVEHFGLRELKLRALYVC